MTASAASSAWRIKQSAMARLVSAVSSNGYGKTFESMNQRAFISSRVNLRPPVVSAPCISPITVMAAATRWLRCTQSANHNRNWSFKVVCSAWARARAEPISRSSALRVTFFVCNFLACARHGVRRSHRRAQQARIRHAARGMCSFRPIRRAPQHTQPRRLKWTGKRTVSLGRSAVLRRLSALNANAKGLVNSDLPSAAATPATLRALC